MENPNLLRMMGTIQSGSINDTIPRLRHHALYTRLYGYMITEGFPLLPPHPASPLFSSSTLQPIAKTERLSPTILRLTYDLGHLLISSLSPGICLLLSSLQSCRLPPFQLSGGCESGPEICQNLPPRPKKDTQCCADR